MNKRPTTKKKTNQQVRQIPQQQTTSPEDSEDEGGFSKWLETSEGAKLMWYFLIINNTIVFLTITWPKIQQVSEIIVTMFRD